MSRELNEILNLRDEEIERLKQHVKDLQEKLGRWRRMAEGKSGRPEYLKERHDHNVHFVDIIVNGLPADTPLHEAQIFMREEILPHYQSYEYHACYRSKKYGWVCTLSRYDIEVNMRAKKKRNWETIEK